MSFRVWVSGQFWALGMLAFAAPAAAASEEFRLDSQAAAASADALAQDIVAQMEAHCVVLSAGDEVRCRFWLCKELAAMKGFAVSDAVLYPFHMGQLLGCVEYVSAGEDFRGQEIAPGWYTVRYAQQPVDGNHIGTSDTRDFLLLCPAADDTSPEPVADEQLIELSKAAAASTHPCMLSLLRAAADGPAPPALVHDENRELFSARLKCQTTTGPLVLEVVLVGRAPE